jgi:hypothetical protein
LIVRVQILGYERCRERIFDQVLACGFEAMIWLIRQTRGVVEDGGSRYALPIALELGNADA